MDTKNTNSLEPRKTPIQARSVVTVDAIFEATVQVLLSEGPQRLTTTRVADRAGVSVGTVYQYYPNKQSLLYAVLEQHLLRVTTSVEQACEVLRHQPLADMVVGLVKAFVDAKTAHVEESKALYLVAAELDAAKLVEQISERMRKATASMLGSAVDARFDDLSMVSFMVMSAMVGPTRAVLEGRAPPKMLQALRMQLVTLCDAYLSRLAIPQSTRKTRAVAGA